MEVNESPQKENPKEDGYLFCRSLQFLDVHKRKRRDKWNCKSAEHLESRLWPQFNHRKCYTLTWNFGLLLKPLKKTTALLNANQIQEKLNLLSVFTHVSIAGENILYLHQRKQSDDVKPWKPGRKDAGIILQTETRSVVIKSYEAITTESLRDAQLNWFMSQW